MDKHSIAIYTNEDQYSEETTSGLVTKLETAGFEVTHGLTEDSDLLICIGGDGTYGGTTYADIGDGTTLRAIHLYDFPDVPIVGINTGHLGFFQEIRPDQVDDFIEDFKAGSYTLQPITAVEAEVETLDERFLFKGINEIVVRGGNAYSTHLNISIGDSFIEKFSGDGVLIATSTGSTAYNYSLGGSIVDPRLKLLQATPIAPMNTTAYRSFTSSILLPPDLELVIEPENERHHETKIINDGNEHLFTDVQRIRVKLSDTVTKLVRFESYDFWNKVKTKFL